MADLSTASVWHRAPVFDTLKIVRPAVSLARDREGRYSIQDLVDRALAGPPAAAAILAEQPRDRRRIGPVRRRRHRPQARAGRAGCRHPVPSSLPYQTAVHVTPRIAGTFNGSHFALGGSTTPFGERREATLDLDVDALPLPAYVVYLPFKPRIDVAGGTLTTRLKIVFVDGKAGERRLELRGDARVDALALNRRDGSTLAKAERVTFALDRIDLAGSDARIASVTIDAPTVDVKRLADGTLEWMAPLFDAAPSRTNRVEGTTAVVERVAVAAFDRFPWNHARNGRAGRRRLGLPLHAGRRRARRVESLDRPGDKAHVKVAFVIDDRIASFSGEADVEPMVPAATGRFTLAKFSLGLLFPYYKSALAVDVQKGSLDFAVRVRARRRRRPAAHGGRGDDHRPSPRASRQPRSAVERAAAGGPWRSMSTSRRTR